MVSTTIFAVLAVALVAGVNARTPQKIVGGTPAAPGEFPYQVSLRVNGQHFCGGAIVSPRHVVTAAHCVAGLSEPLVVATGSISCTDGELHEPVDILYHEYYTPGVPTSAFDIAVIVLGEDIVFNEYQNKIDLPSAPTPVDAMVTATGWGHLSAHHKQVTPSLQKIQLRTISGQQCQRMFGAKSQVFSNQICTYSGPGYGTCMGDSGGPLKFGNTLAGIASYGIPCAIGLPDVFTKIFDQLSWLNSVINA